MCPHVDPTMTVDNLAAVLRLVEGSFKDVWQHMERISKAIFSEYNSPSPTLMERVDACLSNTELRATAAAMCHISSYLVHTTWNEISHALHVAGEVKAANKAATTYLTKGNVTCITL